MCSLLNPTTITQFIGIFGLITSLLLINLLAKTDLNLQENVKPTTKILLGLEWRDLVPFENRSLPKGTELPLSILVYAVLNAIANLFLILASITKNCWYTSPWIFTQSTGIVCQFVSLYIHCTQYHDYQPQLIVLASSYIVIATAFWIIVFYTQNKWRNSDEYSLTDEEKDISLKTQNCPHSECEFDFHLSPFKFQTYKEI